MTRIKPFLAVCTLLLSLLVGVLPAQGQWVTRDHRWQDRSRANWALPRELPALYREFNGIDFGHAHLAETLLRTQDPHRVEQARLEVLEFIFSSPSVPPDNVWRMMCRRHRRPTLCHHHSPMEDTIWTRFRP
jgi:hypothetical protein